MASLYTTKSLGRTWLPSPVHTSTRPSRYGSWPFNSTPPKLRWLSTAESQRNPQSKRWSKTHERFALLSTLLLLGIIWYWCTCSRTPFFSLLSPSNPSPPPIPLSSTAYALYAHNTPTLCTALMHLESLHRLNALPQKLLLYPSAWNISLTNLEMRLLNRAVESYNAVLKPVDVLVWKSEIAVLAANLTEFGRVMALDLDVMILRNLDGEFNSTDTDTAGKGDGDAAAIILSPSTTLYEELHHAENPGPLLAKHSHPIPQILQTSNLRQKDHATNTNITPWSAKSALSSSNIVHFTDLSPWRPLLGSSRDRLIPTCTDPSSCENLQVWRSLYKDFRNRRKQICGERFNEWEDREARDEADRRIIPLAYRVRGVGGGGGIVGRFDIVSFL